MRCIILHGHIFKNAGTTFDWSLHNNFGEGFLDHREDVLMRRDGCNHLRDLVNTTPGLNAISSHSMTRSLPRLPGVEFMPAYILRHPIARIRSVYTFERRQLANTPGARAAKLKNFRDYVGWRMQADVARTIRNYQTVYLAGRHGATADADIAARFFAQALENLGSSPLVGTVEDYDRTMVLFEETLKTRFPQIDLSYIAQNVSGGKIPPGSDTGDEAVARILTDLGGLQKQVIDENSFDLALYQAAVHRMNSRVDQIADFTDKLADFRARCQRRLLC